MTSLSAFLLLLATASYAQEFGPTTPFIAELTLATSSSINSSVECRKYELGPEAILIRMFNNYTDACHNIASVFSPDQDELRGDGTYTCHPYLANCTNDYSAMLLDRYSPDANYSFTRFDIRRDSAARFGTGSNDDEEVDLSEFTLKVFPEEDCNDNESEPWISWGGCEDEQGLTCDELAYGVKSFRIEHTAEEDRGECLLAAERGAGVRTGASVAAVVAGAVAVGFMALAYI